MAVSTVRRRAVGGRQLSLPAETDLDRNGAAVVGDPQLRVEGETVGGVGETQLRDMGVRGAGVPTKL
jgi:hypothetical protein